MPPIHPLATTLADEIRDSKPTGKQGHVRHWSALFNNPLINKLLLGDGPPTSSTLAKNLSSYPQQRAVVDRIRALYPNSPQTRLAYLASLSHVAYYHPLFSEISAAEIEAGMEEFDHAAQAYMAHKVKTTRVLDYDTEILGKVSRQESPAYDPTIHAIVQLYDDVLARDNFGQMQYVHLNTEPSDLKDSYSAHDYHNILVVIWAGNRVHRAYVRLAEYKTSSRYGPLVYRLSDKTIKTLVDHPTNPLVRGAQWVFVSPTTGKPFHNGLTWYLGVHLPRHGIHPEGGPINTIRRSVIAKKLREDDSPDNRERVARQAGHMPSTTLIYQRTPAVFASAV